MRFAGSDIIVSKPKSARQARLASSIRIFA